MTTVRVQLIDAATNQQIGEAELPVEQLPEAFAVSTTLHLGGGDWHVEHAEPVTRAVQVDGGEPHEVSPRGASGIALDGDTLFIGRGTTIDRLDRSGANEQHFADAPDGAYSLHAGGGWLYWAGRRSVYAARL